MKTMTEDEFWDQYKPIKNPFNEGYGFDGCMFETFGPDLTYVQDTASVSEGFVWTVLDGDEGLTIVSGMHHVNRFGFIITELPADEDFIDVILEDLSDYSDEDLEFLNSED